MARASSRARSRLFADEPSLREELEQISEQIVRLGERTIGEGQEKLSEEITRLKSGVDDLLERASDQGRASVDAVAAAVQKRPVTSITGAFVAGMLISALLARR
jgi:ElaB/YqjD/DUF883 family membrane-anchored ribosome-binding protein